MFLLCCGDMGGAGGRLGGGGGCGGGVFRVCCRPLFNCRLSGRAGLMSPCEGVRGLPRLGVGTGGWGDEASGGSGGACGE